MSTSTHYTEQTGQDYLMSYFDKSAMAVRKSFEHFERTYARPTINTILASFRDHPIYSTLLAVFSTLSFLPILSFLGFSLFIFASFVFIALSGAVLFSTVVISAFATALFGTLLVLFGMSLCLTASGIGAYLLFRLVLHIREDGARAGLAEWTQESKRRFFQPDPTPEPELGSSHVQDRAEDDARSTMSQETYVGTVPMVAPAGEVFTDGGAKFEKSGTTNAAEES